MESIADFFRKTGVKRSIIFGLIILILFSVRSMMNLILLTFIFSFLMNGLVEFTVARIKLNRTILILLLYTFIVSLLTVGIVKYLPVITAEISQLIRQISNFSFKSYDNAIVNYIESIIASNQITAYLEDGFSFLLKSFSDISKTSVQVLIALLLSLFFLLEKPRLLEFTGKFKHSKIAPFYREIEYFGRKFSRTFGKVIEAQFMIALINTFLTVIVLMILGFPQIIGLSIMVFFLGLIPVAGVIISLIPLTLIAFTIGGFLTVVYLFIAIMVIHAIEAYILNPKLMSSKTDLPVFYTFIVLIFSQHFFGVWGLIIGIPVFVFLLDILDVTDKPSVDLNNGINKKTT
ncbi:AI-2E family transporter [Oceanobacillus chungangensis]|uniref:AI-2E family transporter n=1 Tax=Oceanobacillus chungangensis TaxID=1229152 RepID=A0A3D8PSP9_9BACI|nr:AI-2E family transporter [Oceanobacillus chungangensis]RDW18597.1 AI-2E family transporter [Oceanobacillus chungangensis]